MVWSGSNRGVNDVTATVDNEVAGLRRAYAELEQRLNECCAERDEALEQQTATAEVLQDINSSPGDLTPAFHAMLERAMRLCGAQFGFFMRFQDGRYSFAAGHGLTNEFAEYLNHMDQTGPNEGNSQVAAGAPYAHFIDLKDDEPYRRGAPFRKATVDLGRGRTALAVPLRKEDQLLGTFSLVRQEVQPFTPNQIELVRTFADQAVIAIDNARLINETREALEQQTATAGILRVISNSPTDVQPTFDAIVASAATLCEAEFSAVARFEDGLLHLVATNNLSAEEAAAFHSLFPRPPLPNFVMGRAFVEGRPAQFGDVLAAPDYDPRTRQVLQSALGYRTFMAVPILRAGLPIGVMGCARRRVQPFSTAQIDLLNTFAEQASIALDNVRLFNELDQRNVDLTEALEYQTATSDVLKLISRSTFDLQPLLDTLAETMARLCKAEMAFILRRDGEVYRAAAAIGWSREYREFLEANPIVPNRGTVTGRVVLEGRAVHVHDIMADPDYVLTEATTLGGARTQLGVPLLRDGPPIGVIVLARQQVEPFSEKQIDLVVSFADQAVIAIENARLMTETREALEQQTATAEVLQVINSSPGDLT